MAFPIEIDATKLIATNFMIPGVTPTWQPTRQEVPSKRIWQMDPGTYQFVLSSSSVPPVEFEVRPDGTVFYADAVAGFLEGRGHSTLSVVGYPITLDASPLKDATNYFGLINVSGWLRTVESPQTVRLLPGSYQLGLYTGAIAGALFEVTLGGTIQYADALDVSLGSPAGYLTGKGTRTLTLAGYAVTLDALPLKDATNYFGLINVSGWLRTVESPQTVRLLPGSYQLGLYTGAIAGALFEVTLGGTIQYADALDVSLGSPAGYLTGKGTRTLRLDGYAVTLDALPLKDATNYFGLINVSGWLRTVESPQTVRLLPGSYQLGLYTGAIAGALFEVTLGGTIQYADALDVSLGSPAGYLTGKGTRTLRLDGYAVTLDGAPLKAATTYFGLSNVSGWLRTVESPQTVRLLPGSYQLGLYTGAITGALFEVTLGGTIQYADALDVSLGSPAGYLTGKGTRTLTLAGYAVTLDALPLKDATNYFGLINVSGWLRTVESPQTVRLLPGSYQLGLYTGAIAGAQVEVTLGGTIDYADAVDVHREPGDPRPPGFLIGKGTATLTLAGYAVTLDATPLKAATGNFRISDMASWMHTSEPQPVHLLPTQYGLIVNATVAVALFEVSVGGKLTYAPECDVSNGGMFQGKGETTLKIDGYSLLVDASAYQGVSVVLTPFNIVIDTAASVPQTIQLPPYRDLALELRGTLLQSAVFDMEHNGSITLLEPYPFVSLEQRDGHPLIRLTTQTLREKRPCRPPAVAQVLK